MNNISKLLGGLLYLAGIGIVIAVFFLFLSQCQEENMFYLNMIMTCIIFTVVFANIFDMYGPLSLAKERGSSFGLNWIGATVYIPLAFVLVVFSIVFSWGFIFCLITHIIFFFIFCFILFMGFIVKSNVNTVESRIEARKAGLAEVNEKMVMLEVACSMGGGRQYLETVAGLKESLKYITASDDRAAVALEGRLADKIMAVTSQVDGGLSYETVMSGLKDCASLIEMRKKLY